MSFIRKMLEEKELIDGVLEFEHSNISHIMPIEVVVEFVENSPKTIETQINSKLSIIDFKNGNILDFIEHIAKGIIQI